MGPGGTVNRRGQREPEQGRLFDDDPASDSGFELGDLERDVNRMRLETSSNVYAQRRAYW